MHSSTVKDPSANTTAHSKQSNPLTDSSSKRIGSRDELRILQRDDGSLLNSSLCRSAACEENEPHSVGDIDRHPPAHSLKVTIPCLNLKEWR